MTQFITEYKKDQRETDVAYYNILLMGLIVNDREDLSWNMIEPTEEGLSCIIKLIWKLRADNRDNFVEYLLLNLWKLLEIIPVLWDVPQGCW
jgi:hypothetical protein